MSDEACRVDVWLWRARFCKTRSLAARLVESGRVHLTRGGQRTRLDKASRLVRPGDELVFAIGGRLTAVRIGSPGARRGPPAEARGLYQSLEGDPVSLQTALSQDTRPVSDEPAGVAGPPRH